jgi:hypothetical protein
LYILRRRDFEGKWCTWIAHSISSVQFFVLLNSTPTNFFGSSHGLRRENPLSSLLFDIVIEALGKMISTTMREGLLSGYLSSSVCR